jgi:hypothetical protein
MPNFKHEPQRSAALTGQDNPSRHFETFTYISLVEAPGFQPGRFIC